MIKKLLLSLISALLLSLPWLGLGGLTLFFAFVPLFLIQDTNPRRMGGWAALTFTLWIVSTTWWVGNATAIATIMVPLVGLFFCWIPFMLFHYIRKRGTQALAWTVFVAGWITFEKAYIAGDISFPWLTLGYGFADTPWAVQWYSATGSFGGSLWVLVSNILAYYVWKNRREGRLLPRHGVALCVWIVVPLMVSLISYYNYEQRSNPVNVCVVQPNIDPYTDKFFGMSQQAQCDLILSLASQAKPDVEYIITPETSLDDSFWLASLGSNTTMTSIRTFLAQHYPKATMILGATTLRELPPSEESSYITRQSGRLRYEAYNSALYIDSSSKVGWYHKSKLVCGAELLPYPEVLGPLGDIFELDLGGISGTLGRQKERTIFTDSYSGVSSGTAICYEAIYGEYFAEYVRGGAEVIFVISNDGWWGDTQGYRLLMGYSRLRAVECRRSIARSANTGISALINQRGDVVQSLGWDEQGVINGTIDANNTTTPYVRHGDLIARISIYTLLLSLLYYVALRYRRKDKLLDN